MKNRWIIMLASIGIVLFVSSCKKDDKGFHQISALERSIYLNINVYRTSQGLTSLVEQFLMFKEGRSIAEKMASGTYTLGDEKAQADLQKLSTNLGGTSSALLSLTSGVANADSIINYLKEDVSLSEIICGEFTQCGVGVVKASDQLNYVAILLINIPD